MKLWFLPILLALTGTSQLASACTVTDMDQVEEALATCDNIVFDNLYVPAGQTLTLNFRPHTIASFVGNTTFGFAHWEGPLVRINGTNVLIAADGEFQGQGELYWDGLGEWGTVKPIFFYINLQNSSITNFYVKNPPQHVALFFDSNNVEVAGWVIDASDGSPLNVAADKAGHNTDGFVIWNSTNMVIKDNVVFNQDDCIALRCGSNILIDDMICEGGHGLSISVGFDNYSIPLNTLTDVTIRNSILVGGENGIHIKTHVDGGEGLIRNVTYKNIRFQGMSNYGINIQENYRNLPANSTMPIEPKNNIPIVDLVLEDIVGKADATAIPIYILCADDGCSNWTFNNVTVDGERGNICNYVPDDYSC